MKKVFALILSVCMLVGVAVFGGASAAIDSNIFPNSNQAALSAVNTIDVNKSKSDDGSGYRIYNDPADSIGINKPVLKSYTNIMNDYDSISLIVHQAMDDSIQNLIDKLNSEKANTSNGEPVTVPIKFTNVVELTPEMLQNILQASEQAAQSVEEASDGKVKVQPVVHADTVKGNKVVARLYIDPKAASTLNKPISTSVSTASTSREAKAVVSKFANTYGNKMDVLQFEQTGSFGMALEVAVKVNENIDPKNATIYSYDKDNNTYKSTNVTPKVDGKGYMHLPVDKGGIYIVSDGKLEAK